MQCLWRCRGLDLKEFDLDYVAVVVLGVAVQEILVCGLEDDGRDAVL